LTDVSKSIQGRVFSVVKLYVDIHQIYSVQIHIIISFVNVSMIDWNFWYFYIKK